MNRSQQLFCLGLAAFLGALNAMPTQASGFNGTIPESSPKKPAPAVRIDEQIGAQVPLDLIFRDENEQPITLADCMGGKVTILVPVYYRCPMNCTETLNGLLDALRQMPPDLSAGNQFNVVTFSLDPKEHYTLARDKKAYYIAEYGRPGAEKGWRFLTGSQESVVALTEAIGYRYEYDRAFKEYNHPSGIIILTPEGKVARYFYGIAFDSEYRIPGGKTTLRLSLVEASNGKIGSLIDKLILLCYRFDHTKGYSLQIMRVVQFGGVITVAILTISIIIALRRERQVSQPTEFVALPVIVTAQKTDGRSSGDTP